jgi:formylglycine-generating enzyme required for sulfatase activity
MKSKRFFLVIFATSLLLGCFMHREHFDEVRKVPKLNYETPPGSVWLRNNLFIDITEITNMDWLEYMYWTDRHEPEKHFALLPDTLIWRTPTMHDHPNIIYYLRHPAYRNYPVVGISYEQAVAYCKWRSDRVNEFIYIREHKTREYKPDSIYPHPEVMRFRLPTKEEWEYAAAAGLDQDRFPFGYESFLDKNNIPVSNVLEYTTLYKRTERTVHMHTGSYSDNSYDLVAPVNSFTPNMYGIYNMTGNVSEIIADTLFKGLNHSTSLDGSTFKNNPKEYVRTDSTEFSCDNRFTFRYQEPKAWLGFRCVCEVMKDLGSSYY